MVDWSHSQDRMESSVQASMLRTSMLRTQKGGDGQGEATVNSKEPRVGWQERATDACETRELVGNGRRASS